MRNNKDNRPKGTRVGTYQEEIIENKDGKKIRKIFKGIDFPLSLILSFLITIALIIGYCVSVDKDLFATLLKISIGGFCGTTAGRIESSIKNS